MISCLNCLITDVQLQPIVWLQLYRVISERWSCECTNNIWGICNGYDYVCNCTCDQQFGLPLWGPLILLITIGQCIHHVHWIEQYASCACDAHFTKMTIGFFFSMKTCNWSLVCFLNFFIALINYEHDSMLSNSVCNHTCN